MLTVAAAPQKTQKRFVDVEACAGNSPDMKTSLRKRVISGASQESTKKKVSFLPMAYVVLIPTSDEYHNAGLSSLLWWNDQDYRSFKHGAMIDLQTFLKEHSNIDPKAAVKLYYNHVENGKFCPDLETSALKTTPLDPVCVLPANSKQDFSISKIGDGPSFESKSYSPHFLEMPQGSAFSPSTAFSFVPESAQFSDPKGYENMLSKVASMVLGISQEN